MNLIDNFNQFYRNFWGERWQNLYSGLLATEKKLAKMNQFVNANSTLPYFKAAPETEIPRDSQTGLLQYYVIDPASVFVAQSLPIEENDKILDLCAAPGGKSLILAENMKMDCQLICNEYSINRRERLTKVIQQYVPQNLRNSIWVTGKDGITFGKKKNQFNKVLADVPCSGERFLLLNSSEFMHWTEKRSQKIAQKQFGLVSAATETLIEGGTLVYSTCSLSHLENEEILLKLLKRRPELKVIKDRKRINEISDLLFGETPQANGLLKITVEEFEFGYQILPDLNTCGPLRWSILQKQ